MQQRPTKTARRLLVAFAALTAATVASSASFAQCTDSITNVAVIGGGKVASTAMSLPLGTGSASGSLSSVLNSVNTAFLTTTSSFVTGGSGVWVRAVGGVTETNTSSVGTLTAGTSGVAPANLVGSINCQNKVKQEYAGFQIGGDISQVYAMGGRFNWGVMGGHLQAVSKDNTPAGTFATFLGNGTIPAGSLQVDTGISFVGLYATYTQGRMFLDSQIRWDSYQSGANDPTNVQAPFAFSGRGFAVAVNGGYSFPLQGNWFVEPSGGVVWSNTSFDPFFVSRGTSSAFNNVGNGPISVDDITSVIGRATLRFGTNIQDGKITWQPYFSYSLFHEFAGDVTVRSIANNAGAFNFDGIVLTTTSKGGVGTYNQFALGIAGVLSPTTTVYARGDYKVGDNLEGWGISSGVRVNF